MSQNSLHKKIHIAEDNMEVGRPQLSKSTSFTFYMSAKFIRFPMDVLRRRILYNLTKVLQKIT